MYLARTPAIVRWLLPGIWWRVSTRERTLYLTFDDGPIPEVTPWVLDTLKLWNARATFFCVGENCVRNSGILERIRQEGHAVGNHTWEHLRGRRVSTRAYLRSVMRTQDLTQSRLFRPPYGSLRAGQFLALRKRFSIVLWDVLSGDFDMDTTGDTCTKNVLRYARAGSIIVFHDSLKAEKHLRTALPETLRHFSALGYTFAALPGLTAAPPPGR